MQRSRAAAGDDGAGRVAEVARAQFRNYLLTVFSPLPFQQFGTDSAAYLPVELRKLDVDRAGNPLTGRINELAYISQQWG